MFYEQLRDNLVGKVPCPPSVTEAIASGIGAWVAFCALPQEVKERYKMRKSGIDGGYERKDGTGGNDRKQIYHFHGDHGALLAEFGLTSEAESNPVVQAFFEYAAEVYRLTALYPTWVAADLDGHCPGIAQYESDCRDRRVVRFLLYDPYDPSCPTLAQHHFDRGGFTLQFFASHEGLEYMDWEEQWKPLRVPRGTIPLIAGYGLQAMTKLKLQNTLHRVVVSADLKPGERRASIVSFNPFPHEFAYPESMRAQDKEPHYAPRVK